MTIEVSAYPSGLLVPSTHGFFRGAHNTGPTEAITEDIVMYTGTHLSPGTFTNKRFIGPVELTGAGAYTFRHCEFMPMDAKGNGVKVTAAAAAGSLFEDCLIDGGTFAAAGPALNAGPGGAGVTVRRCEIRGGDDVVILGSGLVLEDSWCHSPGSNPGAHRDVLQSSGAAGGTYIIQRNRIEQGISEDLWFYYDEIGAQMFANACLQHDTGTDINNALFTDNYFDGGGYIINAGALSATRTMTWTGNRFGPHFLYGQVATAFRNSATGLTWTSNVDHLTGAAL